MTQLISPFLLWCCLFSLPVYAAATTPPPQVHMQMREHGYHLGDTLVQQIVVEHAKTQTVDEKSLPLPGPIKPWLDLRAIDIAPLANGTQLTLTWQVFATVEAAQQLQLPTWTLTLSGQPPVTVSVPASAFYHSPVFAGGVSQIARKPSRPPLMYDLRLWQWLTLVAAALSLLLAAVALWSLDRLPWLPFRPGPLCRAQRYLRQQGGDIQQSLTVVYRGLCQLAGVTLHKQNLHSLLVKAPYLQPLQAEIETFVSRYNHYQFGYQPLTAVVQPVTEDVRALLAQATFWLPQAALLERSFKRSSAQ